MSEEADKETFHIKLQDALNTLGFSISDDNYHADMLNAISQCKLVKKEDSCPEFLGAQETDIKTISEPVFSENYPVTFEDNGLRRFIQDNFAEYFGNITLTDEELEQFKRHLEASFSDWISENWHDFMQNRGD